MILILHMRKSIVITTNKKRLEKNVTLVLLNIGLVLSLCYIYDIYFRYHFFGHFLKSIDLLSNCLRVSGHLPYVYTLSGIE